MCKRRKRRQQKGRVYVWQLSIRRFERKQAMNGTPEQKRRFKDSNERVVLGISHPHYGHMAVLSTETRAALAKDFA